MHILLTGPIGSGKTTQAKLLSQGLHMPLIDTGEIIRAKIHEKSDEAAVLEEYVKQGRLIPDHLMAQLFREDIEKHHLTDYISDSYPRRLSQLHVFDPGIDLVISLEISEEELKRRLAKRGREDDDADVVEKRILVYHQETKPLLDFYKKDGKLLTVSGEGEVKEVTARIEKALQTKVNAKKA